MGTPGAADRAPVQDALSAFFEWYYRAYPVNATFVGIHNYDDRLPDSSPQGIEDRLAAIDGLLVQFHRLDDTSLSQRQALDRRLAAGALEIKRWEHQSDHFYHSNPCVYTGEAIFGVLALFLRTFAPLPERTDAAVGRMLAIPAFLQQAARTLRRAHPSWIERARREVTGAVAFFEGGVERLIRDEGAAHPRLREAAEAAATAFKAFQDYLDTDLSRRRPGRAACGREALDLLLRQGHFLPATAEEIEALGEARFAAAQGELESRAGALGTASWQDALAHLADRHPPAGRYYARYAEVWQEAREAALAHRLVSWPDYPIRFVPQPAWAREAAPHLYFLPYRAPAAFDPTAEVEYLVAPVEPEMPPAEQEGRLRGAHESAIKLNHVIHHGGLGHHVQNWYAYHAAASQIGRMAAVDCASRIALFCGGTMAEGWACYATDLMEEIGFLDPFDQLAASHTRLRLAARAIVDVRLHCGRWTIDDAARYYRDQVGMSPQAAAGEAVKNSMFPGAALMYLVGTELLHALRRDQAARDPGFEARAFHDRLLSFGSIPVSLIYEAMAGAPPRL